MRQFATRHAEFRERGVHLVRVFHSPVEALARYVEGEAATPFPILADPGRQVYDRYGVSRSLLAVLNPLCLPRYWSASRAGHAPRIADAKRDGIGGSPADFLIGPAGAIEYARYGRGFADGLQVDDAAALVAR